MKRLFLTALVSLAAGTSMAQETGEEAIPPAPETAEAAAEPTPAPSDPRMEEKVDVAETPTAEDFEIAPPPDEADPDSAPEITGLLEDEEEQRAEIPVTGTVEVTATAAGKLVKAEVGNLIAITLESNPSTGFNWELRDFERGVAGYYSADLVARKEGNVLFGAPADTIITLQALEPGTQDILLVYRRQWEPPDRIAQSFAFRLEVAGEAATAEESQTESEVDTAP